MNLKQLSQMLGLSQTTVSRALNGYPEVNRETRERVLKAVRETGYRPNKAAQRLATGKAGSIGLVMPTSPGNSSDVHFSEFLTGLGEEALRHDFHFVLTPADPNDEVGALRRLAASGNVDALFVNYLRGHDPRLEMLKTLSIPFLVHGRSIGSEPDYPYLDIDNEAAFYDATKLLLQLGHKRFALLNGLVYLDFAIRRKNGVEAALAERGLTLDEACVSHTAMTDEQGLLVMERLLQMEQRPTAILCSSTVLALGAVRAINQAKLKLGEDISLIAHDDVLTLLKPENFTVPLTTTRSSLRAAGNRIAERLIGEIKHSDEFPSQELWKTELIVRASTGVAPDA
ncbi:transcriptional regulator [Rhizobium sp. AC27/96]|uniref:substrate-binding domain-containing protein n=1 Tax=Rhizobium sp. AC27/96 TaxID=1841653 RepID=UPI000827E4C0|nr:substrate-binding domain-containing protein [Rhizobium sp. AC27/96]OCI97037.1 transcriptional regulator [Rhizobium sp. AC27/96]